jgi:hypothetical protein
MNVIHKSKSQFRSETSDQVEKFLRSGGVIQVVKSRKAPRQLMSGKTTRASSTGTSGFAVGFPKRAIGS